MVLDDIIINYYPILKKNKLFKSVDKEDIGNLLKCLSAKTKTYSKNDIIHMDGDNISYIGIILSGRVQIIKEDYFGNRTILSNLDEGEIFGEAFACANISKIPVTVISATESVILFIDYKRIITVCSSCCVFHLKLIGNMLNILATKNLMLNHKIDCLSKRTTRERLLTYLSFQSKKAESNSFTIPFNRQELADYLCVDRSAMSSELGKMRDEGILDFKKNKFTLYQDNLSLKSS